VTRCRQEAAQRLLEPVLELPIGRGRGFAARLSEIMIHPLTGLPILLAALYLLYQFVGVFGAQTLVGFLETNLFGKWINPWVDGSLARLIPWPVLRELFGGQFGMITLGLRYAVAIILPIVGTFFLAFSVIEDSGYLPRLAMLIDRVFKKIGLNGRAVIPMVLGFGCDTMATIVTRTLETRRERLLSTFLLSLAIPCSAQLGVMLALLNGQPDLLAVWVLVVGGVFLLIGYLTARLMPGESPTFYMELPPLRLPQLRNVVVKTYTRMEWYLREVLPLFVAASLLIWLGRLTGLFDLAVRALEPVVAWIGLPRETALAFLFGFFRRDYGAAGLYDMRATMNTAQLLIATTTMTLFIPCVAQFAVTVKEQGWKTALSIAAFIFPFALLVGGLLNLVLKVLGLFV
jgi:ferrous iron transport protein B